MQQMGQQMPQPGGPPTPAPVKRGTSKMVPIVVSAGLAVGTFCGLLFGVGLGEPATAAPSSGNNVKPTDPSETAPVTGTKPATTSSSTTPAKPATTTTTAAAGSTTTPAAGSAATPAAGSAATKPAAGSGATTTTAAAGSGATAGSAAAKPTVAAETAVKKPKLTVELSPDTVAATAKITVDGKPIEGNSLEIDLGKETKKEVKIVVKASGYKTVEQKVDVDSDVNVKIELIKRSSVPTTTPGTGPRPGGTTPPGGKKKQPGGGGLIDI
jgi:hypothetical protein